MNKEIINNEVFFGWVKAELAEGKSVRINVKGFSMLPYIRMGKDKVVIYPLKADEPKKGDVVLFRYKGRDIMHRVIRIDVEQYIIQGDGNYKGYEFCKRKDIVGIVRQVIRPSGRIVETSSRRWRWESRAWRSLGIFRYFPLKFFGLARRIKSKLGHKN